MTARAVAAALTLLGLLSACGDDAPAASAASQVCPPTQLAVDVPELRTTAGPAHAALITHSSSLTQIWISDYEQTDPIPAFDPTTPAAPQDKARVRLDLIALQGATLQAGTTLQAASTPEAQQRAAMLIETHEGAHGQYLNIRGQARITHLDDTLLCGSFDIGDEDESAAGTFRVTIDP